MPKLNVKVARFEPYPTDEPNSWVVGFLVELENGKSFYVDTQVMFDEANTDEEAVNVAWSKVSENVNARASAFLNKPPVIGSSFEVEL